MGENGRMNGVNGPYRQSNEELASLLIESAEMVKMGKHDHPVLRKTLEAFLQYMEHPSNKASSTVTKSTSPSFGRMAGLDFVEPSASSLNLEQKAATSRKNADRAKADLQQGAGEENNKSSIFSFPAIPGFTDDASIAKTQDQKTAPSAPKEEKSEKGNSSRAEFQRPANPKSSLIANGWIEQQRRSRFRTVWKEVLASLVEGRKSGEETTLWIQRQIVNPTTNQTELEALHQIPVKWLEEVTHFDYSADNRFSLKVFNLQEEFIFRCPKDSAAATHWVNTLCSARENAKKGKKGAAAHVDKSAEIRKSPTNTTATSQTNKAYTPYPFDEEEKKTADLASPPTKTRQTDQKRTIQEMRAIAHGAGIQTVGMERGDLEDVVAKILASASQPPPPPPKTNEQDLERARIEKERIDLERRVKEDQERKAAAAAADEERRRVAAEDEERRRAAAVAEEERRKAAIAEEERRRAAAAEEERRKAATAEEERRKTAAVAEEEKKREELERAAEEERKRRQQEEALSEEHRRRMAERVHAQQEAERRKREEEERMRLEKERREYEEAEHRRRVAEMQERERQEQIRKQQEEYARKHRIWQEQQEEYARQQRLQQEHEARLREEELRRRQQAEQWARASTQPQQQWHGQPQQQSQQQQQQYHAYYQQQQQQQRPTQPTPPAPNAQQQQQYHAYYQQQQQRPPQPTHPPNAQQQQQQSAVNQKYAKMNAESEGAERNSQIRHGVLVHWALLPPMYQALKPIEALITTIHNVFPPSFGVPGHEHFKKWKPSTFDDISTGPPLNQVDTDKINKVVRKLRLVLHPDRLPKDLSADQSFLVRLLWDIVSDAFDEHKKREEDLGWIRG